MSGHLFHYRCDAGHDITSPTPVDACPAYVRGQACAGELRRYGPGSRGPRKRKPARWELGNKDGRAGDVGGEG